MATTPLRFTRHSIIRMAERKITVQDIMDTIRHPRVQYVSKRSGNIMCHGNGFCIVLAADDPSLVITILTNEQPGDRAM